MTTNRDQKAFFKNKARTPPDYESHPIVIAYKEEIFTEKQSIQEFLIVLEKDNAYTVSTWEKEKYLEASLLDKNDGSSYDIWITSPSQITIIPQLRATETSLRNLVNTVLEFKEDVILTLNIGSTNP